MRAFIDFASMRGLPRPTAAQVAAFVEHVCWAHSWYKHLAPDARGAFVVFLATDAGGGFENQPRNHYGWKTTAEYRQLYGQLDYAWRVDDAAPWERDAGAAMTPSPELLAVAGFTLGPACSDDFNAIEVVCQLYGEHPSFLDLAALEAHADTAYRALDEAEASWVADSDNAGATHPGARVSAFREREKALHAHYAQLRAPEVAALENAVERMLDAVARASLPARFE